MAGLFLYLNPAGHPKRVPGEQCVRCERAEHVEQQFEKS